MDDFFDLSPTHTNNTEKVQLSSYLGNSSPELEKDEKFRQTDKDIDDSEGPLSSPDEINSPTNLPPTSILSDGLYKSEPRQEGNQENDQNTSGSIQEKIASPPASSTNGDDSDMYTQPSVGDYSSSSSEFKGNEEEEDISEGETEGEGTEEEEVAKEEEVEKEETNEKETDDDQTKEEITMVKKEEERKPKENHKRKEIKIEDKTELTPWEKWYMNNYEKEIERLEEIKEKKLSQILEMNKEKNKMQEKERNNKEKEKEWREMKRKQDIENRQRKREKKIEEDKRRQEREMKSKTAFKEWLKKHPLNSSSEVRLACAYTGFRKIYYKDGTAPPPPSVVNHSPWTGVS